MVCSSCTATTSRTIHVDKEDNFKVDLLDFLNSEITLLHILKKEFYIFFSSQCSFISLYRTVCPLAWMVFTLPTAGYDDDNRSHQAAYSAFKAQGRAIKVPTSLSNSSDDPLKVKLSETGLFPLQWSHCTAASLSALTARSSCNKKLAEKRKKQSRKTGFQTRL